jgi:hypothetical protein
MAPPSNWTSPSAGPAPADRSALPCALPTNARLKPDRQRARPRAVDHPSGKSAVVVGLAMGLCLRVPSRFGLLKSNQRAHAFRFEADRQAGSRTVTFPEHVTLPKVSSNFVSRALLRLLRLQGGRSMNLRGQKTRDPASLGRIVPQWMNAP